MLMSEERDDDHRSNELLRRTWGEGWQIESQLHRGEKYIAVEIEMGHNPYVRRLETGINVF
jgi:hypothetical protein